MSKRPYTISEVAKMLGVSPSTVSRAMNHSPGVSDPVRKKVLDFVEEIGYRPNTVAQSLSRGRSNMVALILGDIRNPFYADLAFGIQRALDSHGFIVTTFNSEYDYKKEMQFLEFARQYNYSGIILVTVNSEEADKYLEGLELPVLLVNRITEHYTGPLVVTDNFQAGYIAAMHLIELGHKRLGFISGHRFSSASTRRLEGFKQALRNCLLPVNEEDFMEGDLKMTTGAEVARQFLERDSQPTGIAIANDMMALGFLDYCKSVNLSIPQDLSVISFDDIVFSKLHGIELTTVSQHGKDMGEKAAQLILRRIKHPDADYKKIILEPSLIVRNTTAPYKH